MAIKNEEDWAVPPGATLTGATLKGLPVKPLVSEVMRLADKYWVSWDLVCDAMDSGYENVEELIEYWKDRDISMEEAVEALQIADALEGNPLVGDGVADDTTAIRGTDGASWVMGYGL